MPDTVRVTFRYALGAQVRWADRPTRPWTIRARRYHEGAVSTYVSYRIELSDAMTDEDAVLAYEPDLEPWEKD